LRKIMYKIGIFSYTFGHGGKGRKIFSSSEIRFEKNETIAIVGPSGGGKSTFLKILKGIIPEYASGELVGEILFNDKPLSGQSFQENLKSILYLFQNPFSQLIYPTTEEEFLFSMENFNFSKEEMDQKKNEFENQFKLKKIWGKKTNQLSNGECQRLVLSSLLSINPEVLLLDEPTAFLDPNGRAEFYEFLMSVKGKRQLIIVDHHLEEIAPLIDRVIEVTSEGLVREIAKSELLNNEEIRNQEINLSELDFLKTSQLKLSIKNLTFSYEKNKNLLENIEAEFSRGEIIAIKGKNGIGKSTLIKLMAGVLKPKNGHIVLSTGNKIFKDLKVFSQAGFIFQNPESHFFFDTIEEELRQSFKNIESSELKDQIIKTFFHDIDLQKSPFLLSEGEKRRLSILMSVFLKKEILFLDEPTFGQDKKSKSQIVSLMKEFKVQGIIQIIISHDEDFIAKVADRVFVLDSVGLKEVTQ
jgi:energy-coupling factor transporter ATP-binding protein EcfA2